MKNFLINFSIGFLKAVTPRNIIIAYAFGLGVAAMFGRVTNFGFPIVILLFGCWIELTNICDAVKKKTTINMGEMNYYPKEVNFNFKPTSDPNAHECDASKDDQGGTA